jgi:hypothetical protein
MEDYSEPRKICEQPTAAKFQGQANQQAGGYVEGKSEVPGFDMSDGGHIQKLVRNAYDADAL